MLLLVAYMIFLLYGPAIHTLHVYIPRIVNSPPPTLMFRGGGFSLAVFSSCVSG